MKNKKQKGAVVRDKGITIEDPGMASKLFNSGFFGAFKDGVLYLSREEAFYLNQKKELELFDAAGKKLSKNAFLAGAEKYDKRFLLRYSVFRDLRSLGYIPKTALKYGGDFRVYGKGEHPGEAHASWILFVSSEHERMPFLQFSAVNRVAHSVRKNVLFAVVDDEDSVTYYETKWLKM